MSGVQSMSKPNYGQKSMHEYRYRREAREPGFIAQRNKRQLERYYERKAEVKK